MEEDNKKDNHNNMAMNEKEIIDVIAPSRNLSIVLVDPELPEPTGPAFVCNIHDNSPLVDKMMLGDRILAINDLDVRNRLAENVSKLMGVRISSQEG